MTTIIAGSIAIVLYLLASVLLALRLAHCYSGPGCHRNQILLISGIAVLLHASLLYPAIMTPDGLNLAFFNAVSLISLITAALLMLASFQEPVENLGIPVFPVAALSIGMMILYPEKKVVTPSGSWQLDAHILISLLAYSILGLAVLQALLLAIQDRHLHNRQPGGFIRSLPPLQTMESLMFQMVAIGFTLLTLALVTGFLFLGHLRAAPGTQDRALPHRLAGVRHAALGALALRLAQPSRDHLDCGRVRVPRARLFRQQVRTGAGPAEALIRPNELTDRANFRSIRTQALIEAVTAWKTFP